jgi:hypothetical protein
VNNELERTWKDAVLAYFKIRFQLLPGANEENYENFSENSRSSDRESNSGPPEYETGLIITRPQSSVRRRVKKSREEGEE